MSEYEALIDGYRRFRLGAYREQRERYDQLVQGQSPRVMIIACSDSRVDPARVFDTAPGQTFVLRNIANLVPPFSAISGQSSVAAALEYAVSMIEVDHVVIFGHARCGGIAASLAGEFETADAGKHIRQWMEFIAPAREMVKAACALSRDVDPQRALEQAAVRLSLENLRSYPFVNKAEQAGRVQLHGVIFDIADGSLKFLNPDSDRFEIVPVAL